MVSKMKLYSPAKINLTLNVQGKRNGYHTLKSLVVFGIINDVIELFPAKKWSISTTGPFAEQITGKNILNKVVKNIIKSFPKIQSYNINIEKNIPVGGGLGGGSSNAATFIKFLNNTHQIILDDEFISDLGADIPMCIANRPLICSNFGDHIERFISLPELHIQLIGPNKPLLTEKVFKNYNFTHDNVKNFDFPRSYNKLDRLITDIKFLGNDLTESAIEIMPEIGELLSYFKHTYGCLYSAMSGSGATCFAIFENEQQMLDSHLQFKNSYVDYFSTYGTI